MPAPSFPAGRPILEAAIELCHRIFTEFVYDPQATTISTPVDEVLERRHGVCQDFAHLMIACLRSLGLPARYVSGYLRPAAGQQRGRRSFARLGVALLHGVRLARLRSHERSMPHRGHVTIAWGRDYSDVTPVKGIALGGGEQVINVAVAVVPA